MRFEGEYVFVCRLQQRARRSVRPRMADIYVSEQVPWAWPHDGSRTRL